MSVFECDAFDNHEQVVFCSDPETGLRAIIAIHSTVLGPAGGGCRMWNYASEAEAVRDVLRLSRGMSYKAAVSGINLGGGKSVIIGDSRTQKTPELMRAFGRAVDSLGGRYITAEDVGMSVADMQFVALETKFVAGLDIGDTPSGDPSPVTAHGVFSGIQASVRHAMNRDLDGIRIAVQGLGHVGFNLCRELRNAGAVLTVADIVPENVIRVVDEFGATAVAADDILGQDVDVYSPCALGATLNDETIPTLKCRVVAGAANNQLAEARHGQALQARGILYAPDYVINAGGIMNCANEVAGVSLEKSAQYAAVEQIGETLRDIFRRAEQEDRTTGEIADAIAEARIAAAKEAKENQAASRAA